MQDHRVQVRDQVRTLVTCALARAALPAPQPPTGGSLKPLTRVETYDSSWANGGAPAPGAVTFKLHCHMANTRGDFSGGLASSLAEMRENPRRRVCQP